MQNAVDTPRPTRPSAGARASGPAVESAAPSPSPSLSLSPSFATPDWLRRVAVISTTRAESGIYRSLLQALAPLASGGVRFLAGGTHPERAFGSTVETLGLPKGVDVVHVRHFVPGDAPAQIAATAAEAVREYSTVLESQRPDLVFVLGDRTEMLAATLAATIHRIPIAHLHGGDVTEGAYDDACRNAITKLAHVHFPAIAEHARRIEALGEEPWRIHAVGAPALDGLAAFRPPSRDEVGRRTGLDVSGPTMVLIFHPETMSDRPAADQIRTVLSAVEPLDAAILLVGPNADVGHDAIRGALTEFAARRAKTALVHSLPQDLFWSCLAHAELLIGNSSAGILEAPSLRLPVVNVGDRQRGRVRAANVIDVALDRREIARGIDQARRPEFRRSLEGMVNPYGDGHAAERIAAALATLPDRRTLLRKKPPIAGH